VGREQAAGLHHLACPQTQNIKDALALDVGRLEIGSVLGVCVGGSAVYLGQMDRETTGRLRAQLRKVWSQGRGADMQHSAFAKTGPLLHLEI